jgi:hypothetical protein
MRRPWRAKGCCATGKKLTQYNLLYILKSAMFNVDCLVAKIKDKRITSLNGK